MGAAFAVHEKTPLIRPEHLNHRGTVFGGCMMKWADDMAFNAAPLRRRREELRHALDLRRLAGALINLD